MTHLFAQILPPINPGDLGGRTFSGSLDLRSIVEVALNEFILPLLAALAIFYVVWAGYQLITSGGNPEQAEKARRNITYAVIGVVLVLVSFGLVRLLNTLIQGAAPR